MKLNISISARSSHALAVVIFALHTGIVSLPSFGAERLPNIVLILADDLGYGDVGAYNSASKIATPHIDDLARQGIRFTNAHSAAWCVPSRYQLLTGRYMFRTNRMFQKQGLIESGRPTLASVLKRAGYATTMIGKWHLSFEGGEKFDYAKPLKGGPVDHGFDSYYGIHASLDIPPYFFIKNDRAVEAPTAFIETHSSPGFRFIQGEFWEGGPLAPHFKHTEVLTRLTDLAVKYIRGRSGVSEPFFLYLALTAPHTPWLPADRFVGRSGAGAYGDLVMQVDETVGRVLTALKEAEMQSNTVLIFTSDNGPHWYPEDVEKHGHRAAAEFRGMKADAWEGGHRVPYVVRWPGKIAASSTSAQLLSFTDLLATVASLTGQGLPVNAGEDSVDFLPLLLGKRATSSRNTIVHEALAGGNGELLAIRHACWKLIPSSCDVSFFEGFGPDASLVNPCPPVPPSGAPPGQLYNLKDDPAEKNNVFAEHPEIARQTSELLHDIRSHGERLWPSSHRFHSLSSCLDKPKH